MDRTRPVVHAILAAAFVACIAPLTNQASTDTIYVSNQTHSVVQFDSTSGVGSVLIPNTGLNGGEGVAVDTSGNLYVGAEDSHIKKFSSTGVDLGVFATTGLNSPEGLAFDGNGNLFAANFFNSGSIEKFTPAGVGSAFGNTGNARTGLTFDTAGNLYAADNGASNITKFTPAGVATIFATTGVSSPAGIAFDSSGNLYVANVGANDITKYSSSGVYLGIFASTSFHPDGIAFDSSGNLFVVLNTGINAVEKFTPAGVGSIFATANLSTPTYITIVPSSVPEPASVGILTAGIGGLLMRRRRKS